MREEVPAGQEVTLALPAVLRVFSVLPTAKCAGGLGERGKCTRELLDLVRGQAK